MKVLMVNGSPKSKGNTAAALAEVGVATQRHLGHRRAAHGLTHGCLRSTPYTAKSTPNKRTTLCRSSSIPCTIRQFAILPLCLK